MGEGHSAVVGITLLDENMAVEPTHFRDGKDADAAEGLGGNIQHFTLGNVSPEVAIAVALEAIEGDVAGGDIAFQSTPGDIRLAAESADT